MEFDHHTREKYADKYLSDWEKQHATEINKLSPEFVGLMSDITNLGSTSFMPSNQVEQFWQEYKGEASLSAFMKKHCKTLVELYVPKEYLEDYYGIIDQFPSYQYTTGAFRRTIRTKNLDVHIKHTFRLLYSYMVFGSYHATVADYLMDRLSPEALDFKRHDNYYGKLHLTCFDDILAARINAGDAQVIDAVQEAFLSENNTVIVTSDIIRGVIKSKSKELHELLAKFLVAARLQEGVRQVICENADCGRAEAFLVILDAISRENLTRFAAVKRAIATWTGVCDVENMERITDKVFADIQTAVRNPEEAKRMTATNDSVQIMIGLWALGFYEVEDALAVMEQLARTGTRNQLLTISYYNRMVQDRKRTSRVAKQMFEGYSEDYELLAAYMPTYMADTDKYVRESFQTKDGKNIYAARAAMDAELIYKSVPVTYLFEDETEARKHYEILKQAYHSMKKRKQEYFPCIFPWYGVVLERSDFVVRMSLIAYALQDQSLIDEVCGILSDVDGMYSRWCHILMLLHDPQTEVQRRALISYIADKESYSRETAYAILANMTFSDEEYMQLEGYLKYKTEAIRQFVIKLLEKRNPEDLQKSVVRLLGSKQENMRLAGLDLVKRQCEQHPENKEQYAALVQNSMENGNEITEQEKVLFEEITGRGGAGEILSTEGYGLYNPKVVIQLPEQKMNEQILADYFSLSKQELDQLFTQLTAFIDAHAKDEYVNAEGETRLLGNGLDMIVWNYQLPLDKQYPFPELWREFYQTYIKTPKNFWNMYLAALSGYDSHYIQDVQGFLAAESEVFHVCGSAYEIPDKKYVSAGQYKRNMISQILGIIRCQQEPELPREIAVQACLYAAALPEEQKWYEKTKETGRYYFSTDLTFVGSRKFEELTNRLSHWKDDTEFAEAFYTFYRLDEAYQFQEVQKKTNQYYARQNQKNYLSMYSYIKAYTLGLVPADLVYRNAFETLGLSLAVEQLGCFMKETLCTRDLMELKNYMQVDLDQRTFDKESEFYQAGKEFYQKIVDTILNVELKRGDSATIFSEAVMRIACVYGLDRLMAILTALGKDTLDRSTYYSWSSGTGKRECLSHLLQVCYPLAEDTVEKLAKEMKQRKISKERLIETAMYAPQWMDLAEEYLECDGFKSGCYYFMAHMNERFDDKKKAMIAKYTPLTPEELNDGCFDVDWFFEAYEKLGEDMFSKLYKAAKYISDGNKHARARKYADAALGKVTREELEQTINDKRNKDLLMSYGILPVVDEADELHRYECLQKFLKESKQFGAQRRASEAKCVEVALKNLATTAGFADDLRLILAMETALVTSNAAYFEGVAIGDYECKIIISVQGKAELDIRKEGKKLKSVPAAIKKEEAYLAIREFATKLKNQYSRCVQMFERAMEEREYYTYGELQKLCMNPVTKAILTNLVYVIPDMEDGANGNSGMEHGTNVQGGAVSEPEAGVQIGVLSETGDGMTDAQGHGIPLESNQKLRVAHPYDLYQAGCWAEYQKLFFTRQQETGRKQPFKQVFRELYVKLPEEAQADKSRMFAGNQIQPAKTVGALKSRRWVADYENGLQKIYYKENIIATIYAMADWFSPADTEEPTLEYVVFYDRKTFRQMKLSEVPDIVYSEVMRDTDLAVSVAHAGGVDPLTSHSTIEMRKVIVRFNLELFKLNNVTLEGTHAFVKGTHGEYSVHLGSGVIHQVGGHQIHVLPVHSQNRGKIFLPFIDDDPKTAEIMAKVLLFAQDQKIKDPYIMEQIVE